MAEIEDGEVIGVDEVALEEPPGIVEEAPEPLKTDFPDPARSPDLCAGDKVERGADPDGKRNPRGAREALDPFFLFRATEGNE